MVVSDMYMYMGGIGSCRWNMPGLLGRFDLISHRWTLLGKDLTIWQRGGWRLLGGVTRDVV